MHLNAVKRVKNSEKTLKRYKMKKNITKDQIINTALELIQHKSDVHGVNLREIARTLGCAHTNLYNYFSSYNDLLWETRATLQELFAETVNTKLEAADSTEQKLTGLFETFIEMYTNNKGWFRLAWHEQIAGERPQRDIDATNNVNETLLKHAIEICQEFSGGSVDEDQVKQVLHNTICYLVGEISNYLTGKSEITDGEMLKAHAGYEALNMFIICLKLV